VTGLVDAGDGLLANADEMQMVPDPIRGGALDAPGGGHEWQLEEAGLTFEDDGHGPGVRFLPR
jgi:hypothetical protein